MGSEQKGGSNQDFQNILPAFSMVWSSEKLASLSSKGYECAVWVIAVFLAGHGSSRKLDFREESIELRVAFSPLQGGRKGELDGRHGDHFFDGAPCWLGPVDVNATNVH